jgi:hypothetical protein
MRFLSVSFSSSYLHAFLFSNILVMGFFLMDFINLLTFGEEYSYESPYYAHFECLCPPVTLSFSTSKSYPQHLVPIALNMCSSLSMRDHLISI